MLQEVLNLGGEVERERRELGARRPQDREGVARAVQEVRIAEGQMRGAGGDLVADVGQHDLARHDEEAAAVHRRDRTMPAEVQAAAARLGLAGEAGRAVVQ